MSMLTQDVLIYKIIALRVCQGNFLLTCAMYIRVRLGEHLYND